MRRNKYDSAILQRAYNEGYDHGSESLRDHLAGLAMQGLMSTQHIDGAPNNESVASWSYAVADAMMEARNDR